MHRLLIGGYEQESEYRKKEALRRAAIARKQRQKKAQKIKNKVSVSRTTGTDNPVCAISLDKVINDLKSMYDKKYPDAYTTQKIMINGNIKDYKSLCRESMNAVKIKVLKKRIRKYYPSFTTVKILYDGDMKAYNELY